MIIGFGHRSRMGKDTAANFLAGYIRQHKRNVLVVKTSFAAKMKSISHDLYKWAGLQDADFYEKPENIHLREIKLPFIDKTPIEIWIELGTTVGRSIYKDTWLQYPLKQKYNYLIVTDVRFENEADEIRKLGGYVCKVHNPNVPYRVSVVDEQLEHYKKWDFTITNDGDLKSLNEKVINTLKGVL